MHGRGDGCVRFHNGFGLANNVQQNSQRSCIELGHYMFWRWLSIFDDNGKQCRSKLQFIARIKCSCHLVFHQNLLKIDITYLTAIAAR